VADGWCCFVLREEYYWLVAAGWCVLREKYCWLVADRPSEQANVYLMLYMSHGWVPHVGAALYKMASEMLDRHAMKRVTGKREMEGDDTIVHSSLPSTK
jgi:SRSO17 transposase